MKPLSVIITGGGISFLDRMKHGGASKYIESVWIPYSNRKITETIGKMNSACSPEATIKYYDFLIEGDPNEINPLVINAALRSDPPRKGDDRAYIAYENKLYLINFNKSYSRDLQDKILGDIAWEIINKSYSLGSGISIIGNIDDLSKRYNSKTIN